MVAKYNEPDKDPNFGYIFAPKKELDGATGQLRNTYCGTEEVYETRTKEMGLNPRVFKASDDFFIKFFEPFTEYFAPIFTPSHKQFHECAALRKNYALVRNEVMLRIFPDGKFTFNGPEDKAAKQALMRQIAEAMAATLKHEARVNLFTNFFNFSGKETDTQKKFGRFADEHIGAAELYARLVKKQNRFTWNPLNWLKGKFNAYDWNLPPVEESIFRKGDIDEAMIIDEHRVVLGMNAPAKTLAKEAKSIFENCTTLYTRPFKPEPLSTADAEESVIMAHRILDNLRHMNAGDDVKLRDTLDKKQNELEHGLYVAELGILLEKIVGDVAAVNPLGVANDAVFANARLALGKLGVLTLQQAIRQSGIEGDKDLQHELIELENRMPEGIKNVSPRHEKTLINQIEAAFYAAEKYRNVPKTRVQGVSLSPQVSAHLKATKDTMHAQVMGSTIEAISEMNLPEAAAINEDIQRVAAERQQRSTQRTAPSEIGI